MPVRTLLALLLLAAPLRASLITETYSSSTVAAVPDNDANGIVQSITAPSVILQLTEVTVDLTTTGGWNGDLYAYLWHNNVISILVNRPGRTSLAPAGHAGAGMTLQLADSAATDLHLASGPLSGAFQPDGRLVDPAVSLDTSPRAAPLAVFNGLPGVGDWRLYVADVASGGSASVQSWTIHLTGETIVPEPSSFALLALGFVAVLRRRK